MADVIIPTTSEAAQRFRSTLDGNVYRMSIHFNQTAVTWYLDIEGITDPDFSVFGIALVLGADLLYPYNNNDLGELWVIDRDERDEDPTETSLGDRHVLYYVGV